MTTRKAKANANANANANAVDAEGAAVRGGAVVERYGQAFGCGLDSRFLRQAQDRLFDSASQKARDSAQDDSSEVCT